MAHHPNEIGLLLDVLARHHQGLRFAQFTETYMNRGMCLIQRPGQLHVMALRVAGVKFEAHRTRVNAIYSPPVDIANERVAVIDHGFALVSGHHHQTPPAAPA